MKNQFKFTLVLTILITFVSQISFAQLPSLSPQLAGFSGGSEFFAGKIEGKPLIKVNVVSGLRLPGVYHIPVDTHLAELIAYAGGAVDGAELDEIRIRSDDDAKNKSYKEYDFYKLSSSTNSLPTFNNGDIVQIDVSKDSLARTAVIVSILATIATVSLSIMVYNKNK